MFELFNSLKGIKHTRERKVYAVGVCYGHMQLIVQCLLFFAASFVNFHL
jgi:hypothetical protein